MAIQTQTEAAENPFAEARSAFDKLIDELGSDEFVPYLDLQGRGEARETVRTEAGVALRRNRAVTRSMRI